MKKLFFMGVLALIVAGGLFWSCQKDDVLSNPEEGLMLKSGAVHIDQANCNDVCIDLSKETPVYYSKTYQETVKWGKSSKTVTLEIYNTETDLIIKVKSTNGWANLLINGTSHWGNGQVAKNVSGTVSIPLPDDWKACDNYSSYIQVVGDGPQAIFDVTYYLIGICPPTVTDNNCVIRTETAFGGVTNGLKIDDNGAWWYYFDTQGSQTQGIYAGQNLTDGSVTYNDNNLIIDLGSWNLKEGENEAVKIQGYNILPDKRPAAGQFTTYKGTDLNIAVTGSRYYVIHLDVQICE